jgi:hypothetical protein
MENEVIQKRINELRTLVAQFYEEIDAMEDEREGSTETLAPIAGAMEESLELLSKEVSKFLLKPSEETKQEGLKRIPVDSSMASAVGYDAQESILYVEFANTNNIYAYYEVESEVFEELMQASSKGSFIRNNIIDCYTYSQVNRRKFRW